MADTKNFKVGGSVVNQININGGSDNVVMARVNGEIVYQKQLPTPDIYYAERGFTSAIVEYISEFNEEVSVNVNFGALSDTLTIPAGSSVEKEWTGLSQDTHYSSSCYTTLYPWKNSEVRTTVDLITFKGIEVSENSRSTNSVIFNVKNNNTTALVYQEADSSYGPWNTIWGAFTGTKTFTLSQLNPITSVTKYFRLYDNSTGNFSSTRVLTLRTKPAAPYIDFSSRTENSITWTYTNHPDNNVAVTINAVLKQGTTTIATDTFSVASDASTNKKWTGLSDYTTYTTEAYITYDGDSSATTSVSYTTKPIPEAPVISVESGGVTNPESKLRVRVTNPLSNSTTAYIYNADSGQHQGSLSLQNGETKTLTVENLISTTLYEFKARIIQDGVYSLYANDTAYTYPKEIRFATYSSPTENRMAWRYYNDSPNSISAQIAIRRGTTVVDTSTITIAGNSSATKYWYSLDPNTSYSTRARAVFQGLYSGYTYSSTQTTTATQLARPTIIIDGFDEQNVWFRVKNNDSEYAEIHYDVYDSTPDAGYYYLSPGATSVQIQMEAYHGRGTVYAQAKRTGYLNSNVASKSFEMTEETTTN